MVSQEPGGSEPWDQRLRAGHVRTIKSAFDLAIRERLGHSAGGVSMERQRQRAPERREGWDRGMWVNFSLKELSRPGKETRLGRREGMRICNLWGAPVHLWGIEKRPLEKEVESTGLRMEGER